MLRLLLLVVLVLRLLLRLLLLRLLLLLLLLDRVCLLRCYPQPLLHLRSLGLMLVEVHQLLLRLDVRLGFCVRANLSLHICSSLRFGMGGMRLMCLRSVLLHFSRRQLVHQLLLHPERERL